MATSRFRTWPITEARALEPMLKEMGLKVPAAEIDGTGAAAGAGGKCFSDALVSVGPAGRGGTGSFVSPDGLIITNHHVALDAVRQASTVEHDHLANGFVARSRGEEIRGPDYEVWITRSCEDVSARVLEASRAEPDALARANKVRERKREIVAEKEATLAGAAGMRCEVTEMWADRTYVLFTFERLRDVRIVYVPPMSLGNFGGDTDNFEWPRHSADFTLLRAYVGPGGEAAEPSPDNVPYRPSKHLRVSREGVAGGDFVFLLGFPGQTMRYAPSSRLAYADDVDVPQLVSDFGRKLDHIAAFSEDRAVMLKLLNSKKSLANEHKRSSGKRVMMRKLGLLAERRAEEAKLREVAPEAGPIQDQLAAVYDKLRAGAQRRHALQQLEGFRAGSTLFFAAHTVHEAVIEGRKPDGEREDRYRDRNRTFLLQSLVKRLNDLHPPHEARLVADACATATAAGLPALAGSDFALSVENCKLRGLSAEELNARMSAAEPLEDEFVGVAAAVYEVAVKARDEDKALLSERDQLLNKLFELQKSAAAEGESFYPDANSTLRFSAGHIEGYEAADAVQHSPITTLAGLVDKHEEARLTGRLPDGKGEFACPPRLVEVCQSDPSALRTPVNCLYSTDTVGGNSGSPVLNATGEFVAINFDRQRQGLMNEYKWSHQYSRSIGVDSRYVVWLVGTYDGAAHLVEEMTA